MLAFLDPFIEHYGQLAVFLLTIGEHFILPIFMDPILVLGLGKGLNPERMFLLVTLATFIGSLMGYFLGRYLGHPIITWLFGKKNVDKAEKVINKWGVWGVITAGLTPIPFKLMTWLSGAFEMPLKKFLIGVTLGRLPRYLFVIYASKWFFESKFYSTPEMSAVILGVVQGIGEFLPISSSGHLVVLEHFLKLPIHPEQLMLFDIFLHGGSLLAIIIYFWKDWWNVLKELGGMIKKRRIDHQSMSFKLALATIPAIIGALTLKNLLEGPFRTLTAVSIFFIFTGIFFFYVTFRGKENHLEEPGIKKSVLIGLAQAIALVPGISRSGATMGTGVLLGLTRKAAAKFSFMLGGIAILAANVYALFSILTTHPVLPPFDFLMIGTITSFIISLASVYFLMKFLQKYTLRVFGVYLILMGGILLSFF